MLQIGEYIYSVNYIYLHSFTITISGFFKLLITYFISRNEKVDTIELSGGPIKVSTTRNSNVRAGTSVGYSYFTSSQKDDIVRRHNYYRRTVLPSAADLSLVTWDDQLARMATYDTNRCAWDGDLIVR